jgi:predicted transcriptional regulator
MCSQPGTDKRYSEFRVEVSFTTDQEKQLTEIALHEGVGDARDLLRRLAIQLIEDETRFRAAVLQGKASAERGKFIDEDEMDARFEKLLRA